MLSNDESAPLVEEGSPIKNRRNFSIQCPLIIRMLCFFSVVVLFLHLIYFTSLFSVIQSYASNFSILNATGAEISKSKKLSNDPTVLFWTTFYGKDLQKSFAIPTDCPVNCIYTSNHNATANASIRVFHYRDVNTDDLPPQSPTTINLLLSWESPRFSYFEHGSALNSVPSDYFNGSISYRTSSDVYAAYDVFMPIDGSETSDQVYSEKEVTEAVGRKILPVAVAVSHCGAPSSRDVYIRQLSQHTNITQVGFCNHKPCDDKCLDKLIAEHYFYLAFENSVCPEYITEKFWRIKRLIVPIVLSRGAVPLSVPSDSFIAASDFNSPKELAEYLASLIADKTKYLKYFGWTKRFRRSLATWESATCQLCVLAHENIGEKHFDFNHLWGKDECIPQYGEHLLDANLRNQSETKMATLVRETFRWRNVKFFN